MKWQTHIFFILLSFLCWHCQKVEAPAPEEGAPIFTLDALLDGQALRIAAGDSAYLMRASYRVDTSGLFVYQGRFEQLGCSMACRPAVQFNFRGVSQGQSLPDSALRAGPYPLVQPQEGESRVVYRMAFFGAGTSTTGAPAESYLWDFGDGSSSTMREPVHEYPDGSPRRARLETKGPNGCFSLVEKRVSFDTDSLPCQAEFTIRETPGGMVEAVLEDSLNLLAEWSWGQADSFLTNYPLGPLSSGDSLSVCLRASNQEGCTVENCKTAFRTSPQAGQEVGYCSTTFTYQPSIDTVFIPPAQQRGAVWVEYTDTDGQQYSSAWGSQPASSQFFELLSAETFDKNENGQPTRKLEADFRCLLYTREGQFWRSFSGKGTLAVAHP